MFSTSYRILEEPVDYCERPEIPTGDFNINFSLSEAKPLLDFLKDRFSFDMFIGRNDPRIKRSINRCTFCKQPR